MNAPLKSVKSPAKVTKTVRMAHAKSTPGTHVYTVEAPTPGVKPLCSQVYLSRDALPDPPPSAITLTVEFNS